MHPSLSAIAAAGLAATPWYNQPIVTTLLTLALGGLILNWLKERWARQEKQRDKALEFLESTGDRLNHVLSLLFGTLRSGNLTEERLAELRARRAPVFEKRFAVRLGAEAYLRSPAFARKYDLLANQLFELVEVLARIARTRGDLSVLEEIRRYESELEARWPGAGVPADPGEGHAVVPGDQALSEMLRWTTLLWRRSIQLVSVPLRDALTPPTARALAGGIARLRDVRLPRRRNADGAR
ncbi:MAG TPA: hypothetical protein VGO40_14900 [Longimicrobium sp.]|jgi:hypothetical protein|nr:hypothetical protein [Longimicrobium sp.]